VLPYEGLCDTHTKGKKGKMMMQHEESHTLAAKGGGRGTKTIKRRGKERRGPRFSATPKLLGVKEAGDTREHGEKGKVVNDF